MMCSTAESGNSMSTDRVDVSDLEKRLDTLRGLLKKNDPTDAIHACDKFNKDYPVSGHGWSIASHLALRINDVSAAIRAIDFALNIDPARTEWLLQKANCLAHSGRIDEAKALAAKMATGLYPNAQLSSAVGLLLSRLGMHREANALFEDAIKQEPGVGGHYYNLASVQRFLGEIKSAEMNLNRAIELDPVDVAALALRSGMRKQTVTDNHVAELKRALDVPKNSPRATTTVCYALAKELEDLEEHSESFDYLKKGADVRREHIDYSIDNDLETMNQIQSEFDESRFAKANNGHIDATPIFVIGMPRTGTTLIEKILGSHSVVKAAGELNNFAIQLTSVARETTLSPIRTRADLVTAAGQLDVAQLGNAYMESCKSIPGRHAHFVDKMPMNFLYAGLIHLALPKARIIHAVRDPMDTCYAVFKTLFEGAYPYSYKLDELARYFTSYHRLMEHWERMIPGVMLQVRYEDLVADGKTQTQSLLDYCGLSWEQQCLDFHNQQNVSTTASAIQVRQPLYKTSVGKWRNYSEQLQPVAEILDKAGIHVSG
jgi:tetratricopeptide (TPR) repeat protein